ncbi:MAG: glucose 1-dehydrogenase [Firmicutes bacterium]|nr:glucose 1-dehydrogenase [Bacillota bacterium]
MSSFSLAGKKAVVTGGSSGLGAAAAQALAQAGADIAVADIDGGEADSIIAKINDLGRRAIFIRTDVSMARQVEKMVAQVKHEFKGIDILVTSAGVGKKVAAEYLAAQEWEQVMAVNLKGVFLCCQKVGREMIRRKSGSIVNISSMSGTIVNKDRKISAYCASKGGVIMLTKSLATEWARYNVRVNSIAPGYFTTPFNDKWMADPAMSEAALELTPMKRFAAPEEIGPAAVFLASGAASFITGHILLVDGGYTAW